MRRSGAWDRASGSPRASTPPRKRSVSTHPGVAVIVSGHDYRSTVRANMHPIAEALAELGHAVCFLSVGFSPISWLQNDRRCLLWRRLLIRAAKNSSQDNEQCRAKINEWLQILA